MNFAYTQQNKRAETVSQCHLNSIPKSAFFYRFLCGMKAKMQSFIWVDKPVRINDNIKIIMYG
jgi:hypothetical protein